MQERAFGGGGARLVGQLAKLAATMGTPTSCSPHRPQAASARLRPHQPARRLPRGLAARLPSDGEIAYSQRTVRHLTLPCRGAAGPLEGLERQCTCEVTLSEADSDGVSTCREAADSRAPP